MHYSLIFSFGYYSGKFLKAKVSDKFKDQFLGNNNGDDDDDDDYDKSTTISLRLLFRHFDIQLSLIVTKYTYAGLPLFILAFLLSGKGAKVCEKC